jgi:hypothetical protein
LEDTLPGDSVISEELQQLVNVEFEPEIYDIEKGMLARFAEAIDDPNPRWLTEAPPTFLATVIPHKLLHKLFNADIPLKRLLNGSSELEYLLPIRAGDTVAVTAKLTRLRQVAGTAGPTLFMFTDMTYTNQRGEIVARGKNTYIRY